MAPRITKAAPAKSMALGAKSKSVKATGGAKSAAPDDVPSSVSEVREPGTRIGFLIHDVSRMRRTLYDQAVKPLGLTRSQWWLLAQLSRQDVPDGMPQIDLARLLDVGKVTIGGLIDRLEERGFVLRKPDPIDRRAKRVTVTDHGRSVLGQMVKISRELNSSIFAGFTQAEVKAAENMLSRMKANIRKSIGDRTAE